MIVRSLVLVLGALSIFPGNVAAEAPWEVNTPICTVKRELCQSHPKPRVAVFVSQRYVGPAGQLEETVSFMAKSDTPYKPKRRRSSDNGRTWSVFEPIPEIVTHVNGTRICWTPLPMIYDPSSKALVAVWLRQTKHKGTYYNHCFIRLSRDFGHTWGEPQLLHYEEGADFDPKDPFNPDFLNHNVAYFPTNLYLRRDGSLLLSLSCCNVPDDAPDLNPQNIRPGFKGVPAHGRNGGAITCVGRWDADSDQYTWTASNVVWVPRHVSSRGLSEPTAAELVDGRLLTIYRCSNVYLKPEHHQPGRKRYSISTDGDQ
ncbi:MAG: exo-alpha-sialidase [Pirellulales bacterium]|nr:exo-alpha-sialidase [Pirellulales bacterium]